MLQILATILENTSRSGRKTAKQSHTSKRSKQFKPQLECLEGRALMSRVAILDFEEGSVSAALMQQGGWDAAHPAASYPAFRTLFNNSSNMSLDADANGKVDNADATRVINKVLAKVRQDYAAYDLEVKLGTAADFTAAVNATERFTDNVLVAITGGRDILTGDDAAGVAPVDSNATNNDVAFAFGESSMLGLNSADQAINFMAEVVSHEMGHTFGLNHVRMDEAIATDAVTHQIMNDGTPSTSQDNRDLDHDFNFQDIEYPTDGPAPQNDHQVLLGRLGANVGHTWMAVLKPGELTISGSDFANTIAVKALSSSRWQITIDNTDTVVDVHSNGRNSLNPFNTPLARVRIFGLNGDDVITVNSLFTSPVLADGGAGSDTITGGAGDDTLYGNQFYRSDYANPNILENDSLTGGGGKDSLEGGVGNDVLAGGTGDDTYVFAGSDNLGDDTIEELAGNIGTDTLSFHDYGFGATVDLASIGAQTVAQVFSGWGSYLQPVYSPRLRLQLTDGQAIENVVGSAYDDNFKGNTLENDLEGLAGNDTLEGRAGNDVLRGGIGSDTYNFSGSTDLGGDIIEELPGTVGTDSVSFAGMGFGVGVDLASTGAQTVAKVFSGFTVVTTSWGSYSAPVYTPMLRLQLTDGQGIENVIGTAFDDSILGNDLTNSLKGGNGNDVLRGRAGNDIVSGGEGTDRLYGDEGRDLLIGGVGTDYLYGGAGEDILIGGTTTFDANDQALRDILNTWGGRAATTDYADRLARLRTGIGSVNGVKLNADTVPVDKEVDSIFGENEGTLADNLRDWFWAFGTDTTSDKVAGEKSNMEA